MGNKPNRRQMNKLLFALLAFICVTNAQLNWSGTSGDFIAGFGGAVDAASQLALNLPGITATVSTSVVIDSLELGIGIAGIGPTLSIDAGKNITMKTLVFGGGAIQITGDGMLIVTETLNLNSDLTIEGNAQGSLMLDAASIVAGTHQLIANVAVDGSVVINGGLNLAASAGLTILANSDIVVMGTSSAAASAALNLQAGANFVVSGAFDLASATITADAASTFAVEGNSASVMIGGSATLGAVEAMAGGSLEIAASAAASTAASVTVGANAVVSLMGSGSAGFTVAGDVDVQASGALHLEGRAMACAALSLAASASYEVMASTNTPATAEVSGEASLNGEVVLELAASFTFDADVTLVTYGSVSGTFNSLVLVSGSSKRELQASDFTVEYQGDKAVAKAGSSSTTGAASVIASLAVVAAALFATV